MRTLFRAVLLVAVSYVVGPGTHLKAQPTARQVLPQLTAPLVVAQIDVGDSSRSRLVLVRLDGSVKVLTGDLFAARDPEVSFDGTRVLFSAKETDRDRWAIYEMRADGTSRRRVVAADGDCRDPRYLSTLYTIVSDKPWYQIAFVAEGFGGDSGGSDLYSCKLDGSELGRLTYNLGHNSTPYLMPDGRLLFSVRHPGERGGSLFGINIDGTDYATFLGSQGRALNRMPTATTRGLVVFVECDDDSEDGGGTLSAVHVRRPLHSYHTITDVGEGRFHSPAPGPDGTLLVSRRSPGGGDTYGVVLLDPASRKLRTIFDDRKYHDLQAQQIAPRSEPDGRSSVVTAQDPYGELYCLNVAQSDDPAMTRAVENKQVRTVRIYQGKVSGRDQNGLPLVEKQLLGEAPLASDGSFNLKVPANTPLQIQLLDDQGAPLRSCRWIWARNHEPRGCIGCHEDDELSPDNWFIEALKEPSVRIGPPNSPGDSQENESTYGESE